MVIVYDWLGARVCTVRLRVGQEDTRRQRDTRRDRHTERQTHGRVEGKIPIYQLS